MKGMKIRRHIKEVLEAERDWYLDSAKRHLARRDEIFSRIAQLEVELSYLENPPIGA